MCAHVAKRAALADQRRRHQSRRKLEAAFNTCLHKGVASEAAAAEKYEKKLVLMGDGGDRFGSFSFCRKLETGVRSHTLKDAVTRLIFVSLSNKLCRSEPTGCS